MSVSGLHEHYSAVFSAISASLCCHFPKIKFVACLKNFIFLIFLFYFCNHLSLKMHKQEYACTRAYTHTTVLVKMCVYVCVCVCECMDVCVRVTDMKL